MLKDSKASLDHNIITHPAHYIEGRAFEPMAVIEDFGLCHHLTCVVKYIARAGRKTSLLNDLRKAEWYLDREVTRQQAAMVPCSPPLKRTPEFKVDAICEDWGLPPHLGKVLSCILNDRLAIASHQSFQWFKKYFESSGSTELLGNAFLLLKAREYLRLAISECEQGDSK